MGLEVSKQELAWASGLYDGEGHTGLHKNGKAASKKVIMQILMTDPEVVDRFHRAIGNLGYFHTQSPRAKTPDRKPVYKWATQCFEGVQQVAILLWPYLSNPKKTQIKNVLAGYVNQRHYSPYPHSRKTLFGLKWDGVASNV